MSKKVFWNGKKVKLTTLSPMEQMLDGLLNQEKKLTAEWYRKISGEEQFAPGQRKHIAQHQDDLALEIDHMIGRMKLASVENHGS